MSRCTRTSPPLTAEITAELGRLEGLGDKGNQFVKLTRKWLKRPQAIEILRQLQFWGLVEQNKKGEL
jgi:hypothetical protein